MFNWKKTILIFVMPAMLLSGAGRSLAAENIQFNHNISGTLDVQMVDENGFAVTSPELNFSSSSFSMTYQSSTATLGTSSERLRVTNPSGITDTWTLSLAATGGSTAVWSSGSMTYDFNDSGSNATDGADSDSVGGQMTIDPSVATIAGVGGTATANVSKGTQDSFVEGSVDSIDLMSAAAGAAKPGQWDMTGIGVSQTIPGAQGTGDYSIGMVVTAA